MIPERTFHVVKRQVIGWLDGAVPLWGSFMTNTVLPCVSSLGENLMLLAGSSVLLSVHALLLGFSAS